MTIRYTRSLDDVDWTVLASVFERASLGTPQVAMLEQSYRNSALHIFSYDSNELIGAARAISDGVYHAALCDTVVLPEYQGKGIGRHMVETLLHDMQGLKVILTASFGKEGFYKKLGFQRHKTALAYGYGP
jgi:ribosomal protein S18 acetylase RimI-like enzyme